MKKILFLLFLVPILLGCSDDNESTAQTFFVNVYTQLSKDADEKLATISNPQNNKCYVYLFENKGKTVDKGESYYSVYRDGEIVFSDGSIDFYKYKSSSTNSVNTFEDIPNGNYILFVAYVSYGYVSGCSHKNITVNYDYRGTMEKKIFIYKDGEYGYQDWDETW